jgi:vesicle coat complex subunit
MEAISTHDPKDASEAEDIAERTTPRLAHSNPSVILSAAKVILKAIDYIDKESVRAGFIKKMSAPLVSLMSCEPEFQYVACRNI